jgi:ferritin-like metal-binding protein YciE
MKHYKVIIKVRDTAKLKSSIATLKVDNNEVVQIIGLLKQHPENFCTVMKQALANGDEVLINFLADSLLNHEIVLQDKEIYNIMCHNNHELLVALATHGYTKIIHSFLHFLPSEQQSNKPLILSLITAGAINGHANIVDKLIKRLFPE